MRSIFLRPDKVAESVEIRFLDHRSYRTVISHTIIYLFIMKILHIVHKK